jgi:NAD(P)H dehydrogenase (quinone)
MSTIAIVYHTTYGHTKILAEAVQRGAQSYPGATVQLYTTEEATAGLEQLDSADAIIFGCPTYMGSMSAGMKAFIEAAAAKWFTSAWKDKIAGAFTNSSSFSGDKVNTLVGLIINAMQQGMIYVGLGMMPSANRPGDMNTIAGPGPEAHNRVGCFMGPASASFQVNPPGAPGVGDLETGELYGLRVATITAQFLKGRAG